MTFTMQDRCLGMFFNKPVVKYAKRNADGSSSEVALKEGDSVIYFLNEPKLEVQVERITPFLMRSSADSEPEKANGRCGRILYTPVHIKNFESLVSEDIKQINPDEPTSDSLNFEIQAKERTFITRHSFKLISSSEVSAYPRSVFEIPIVVNPPAPCILKFTTNFLS